MKNNYDKDLINKLISRIYFIAKNEEETNINKSIANYFVNSWENKILISSIETVAKKLSITKSVISKFLQKYKLENYTVMRFVFKLNHQEKNLCLLNENADSKINKSVSFIEKSKRILFMGSGNSGNIAKIFYTRLVLENFNGIYVEGSQDQKKMLSNMTKEDLIICISSSLEHIWSEDLLNNKNNKKILFTSLANIKEDENTIIFSYNENSNKFMKIFKTLEDTAEISKNINSILLKLDKKIIL